MAIRENHPNVVVPYLLVITRILPCVLLATRGTIITLGGGWLNALPLA